MNTIAPAVRKRARELNVNLNDVQGTGKNGSLKVVDVENHAGVTPTPVVNNRQRDEGDARAVANHMQEDTRTIDGMNFKRPDRAISDYSTAKKLDIPKEYLNNDLSYRWVTDSGGRVENFRERLGYQEVPTIKTSAGDEIKTRRRIGTAKDGSPLYAHLMATPKEWRNERRQKADQARKVKMQDIANKPSDDKGTLNENEYYMKNAQTRIQE